MSLIHQLYKFSEGGVTGLQSGQRDWSPFVVHFTHWASMEYVRNALKLNAKVSDVKEILEEADEKSCAQFEAIAKSGEIWTRSPSAKDSVPPCVCLSECTLPGLISHAERFGRFGFVFRKTDIMTHGGAPCIYLREQQYAEVAATYRDEPVETPGGKLFGLSNIYRMKHLDGRVQDYTHEREWRTFAPIKLDDLPPVLVLCPVAYVERVRAAMAPSNIIIVPLDILLDWGA